MLRKLNIFVLHLRMIIYKNKLIYLMLLVEFILLMLIINITISVMYNEFHYKIKYLNRDNDSKFAVLSLNNSLTNNLFMYDGYEQYTALVNEIKSTGVAEDVGYVAEESIYVDGINAAHIIYNNFLVQIKHPVSDGRWLNEQEVNECVIGGDLSDIYSVGDCIIAKGISYRIVGKLTERNYCLNTSTGGTLDITCMLDDYSDVIITVQDEIPEDIFASLIIKYDYTNISTGVLRSSLAKYGIVYTFDDLYKNAEKLQYGILKNNLPIICALLLIATLISTGGILISLQNNLRNYAIMSLYGEKRRDIVFYIMAAYALMLFLAFEIMILLCKTSFIIELIGPITFVPEGKMINFLIFVLVFIVNLLILRSIFRKEPLKIYINNR